MSKQPVFTKMAWLLAAALALPTTAATAQDYTYRDPAAVVPHGIAPHVKEHLVGDAGGQQTYALILYDGDEVFTALTDFAKRHKVSSAHFTAIGAIRDVEVGWLDLQRKQYRVIPVSGQVEVLSLIGDVGLVKNQPTVHAHMAVGLPDGQTRGGHLIHAVASPTVEVFITTGKARLDKQPDENSGMTLFQ